MKLLIWPGHHDCLDWAIKLCTHGRGSHAAFLRSDDRTIHEAFWPRLRDRLVLPPDRRAAEVYELAGSCGRPLSAHEHARFEHLFDANLRRRVEYSLVDLLRYACNCPSRDEHHTFCSRYVMHCLHTLLADDELPLLRLMGPADGDKDWASPRDLRISPRLTLLKGYLK